MTRAPFSALLAGEAQKASRATSTYVLAGILAAYAVLIVFALASVLAAPAGAGVDANALLGPLRLDAVGFVAGILSQIALVLLVVFAATMVAQEFSRGTLRTLLLARARRQDVAFAKLALLAAICVALALFVLVAAEAGAAVFAAVAREPLGRGAKDGPVALFARILLGLLAWTLLAFGTTLASRSLGVGIGATLGASIAGDLVRGLLAGLGNAGVWASRALPNTAIAAISGSTWPAASDWLWIVPNLLVYVVGLNAWALWKLRTLDVIAATK